MNRLLLTAAAILTMGVSSHAMAVTYSIDTFNDGAEFYSDTPGSQVITSDETTAGPFERAVSFAVNNTDSDAYFGDNRLSVSNPDSGNSTLTVTYNIGSLTGLGTGMAKLDFNVVASDANTITPIHLNAYLDNSLIGSWTSTTPILLNQPATYEPSTMQFSAALLNGTSNQLKLVIDGTPGYDYALSPLSVSSIAAVPEPGILPMLGSGLLVVGMAARRRTRRIVA